jgi:hypothetical protein
MPYQTVLFVLQNQILSSKLLESFAVIIGSAFQGRHDKPAAITEAFQEFWQTCSGVITEPVGGWPMSIQSALGALLPSHGSDKLNLVIDIVDNRTDQRPVKQKDDSDHSIADQPIRLAPETCVISVEVPVHHHPVLTKTITPGTPRSSPNRNPSTPPRRCKHQLSATRLLDMEQRSPLLNLQRPPVASSHSSPLAKRKDDKENIGMESVKISTGSPVLGKRKLADVIDDATDSGKRKRAHIFHQRLRNQSNDIDGEMNGVVQLVVDTKSITITPKTVTNTIRPKKRKVEFLDAVEVPTYQQVVEARRRAMSSVKPKSASSCGLLLGHQSRVDVRTETSLIGADNGVRWEGIHRKKTRLHVDDDSDSSESELSLHDVQIAGSGKLTFCWNRW